MTWQEQALDALDAGEAPRRPMTTRDHLIGRVLRQLRAGGIPTASRGAVVARIAAEAGVELVEYSCSNDFSRVMVQAGYLVQRLSEEQLVRALVTATVGMAYARASRALQGSLRPG